MYNCQYIQVVFNWNEFDLFYYIENYTITSPRRFVSKTYTICPSNLSLIESINKDESICFEYLWCDLIYDILGNNQFLLNSQKYLNFRTTNNKFRDTFLLYYIIFN